MTGRQLSAKETSSLFKRPFMGGMGRPIALWQPTPAGIVCATPSRSPMELDAEL